MADIRQWLEDLDLGQYADAFEAADVEMAVLAELDDSDLKELGVSLGHRKLILKAIRDAAPADESSVALPPMGAERRQLTVMFCDLVGSTALAERLDPEDLRELMAAYQKAAGAVIDRYAGHIAQYLGDGVMAYFGWPRAHEDDAQRAVRAGLEIIAAIKAVAAPDPLRVRVGIATGPVVVGETGAGDAAVPKAAVGETPNIAARAQALAGPDQIVIAPTTHRLTGGTFDYDDLGPQDLKGLVEPLRLWRVVGESAVTDRFAARAAGGLTPLVGRDSERAMLMERWRQAADGEGQVVLLSGEPGIGKSRILQALRDDIGDQTHVRLRYQCSPYYTNAAFYPIADQLERAAGFDPNESPDAKLDKLEALLSQTTDDLAQVAPLIAAMLSLPVERYPPLNLSLQKQKDNTIAALAAQTVALAERQPVLMLFEDAHWSDPTTLEALGALIDRIHEAAILLIITHRPEFTPPWGHYGHVTAHALNRLGRKLGASMVAEVTGGKPLPDEVLDQIVAKTDGVPLFVEELTRSVLESGVLTERTDGYVLDGPLPALAIPATLQDSLIARLDHLAAVKEVAQTGACIGREFAYPLLAEISPLDDDALQAALGQLVDSNLVFARGAPPDASYMFKHALVQDAAYESLLKSRRQDLHRVIATTLNSADSQQARAEPALIAHHYTQAGMAADALPHWMAAGRRASSRAAYDEGIRCLTAGLELLPTLPADDDRKVTELECMLALCPLVLHTEGYGATKAGTIYERAHNLSQDLDSTDGQFKSLMGLQINRLMKGQWQEAFRLAEDLMRLAEVDPGRIKTKYAHLAYGAATLHFGRLEEALDNLRTACALIDVEQDRDHVFEYGLSGIDALNYAAWAQWMLGYPDQALQSAHDAMRFADEAGHPSELVHCLIYTASELHLMSGYAPEALTYVERAIPMAESLNDKARLACARILHGWAVTATADPEVGLAEMAQAIEDYKAVGNLLSVSRYTANLADVYGRVGRPQLGLALIDATLAEQESQFSEIHRIKGELLLQTGAEENTAQACFQKAMALASNDKAKSWELRAATSLARLWQSQGKPAAARDLLAPIYGWFTEGFDTADLKAGKALLDELG